MDGWTESSTPAGKQISRLRCRILDMGSAMAIRFVKKVRCRLISTTRQLITSVEARMFYRRKTIAALKVDPSTIRHPHTYDFRSTYRARMTITVRLMVGSSFIGSPAFSDVR